MREAEFNTMFDSILDGVSQGGAAVNRAPAAPAVPDEDKLRTAMALFYRGEYVKSLGLLRQLDAETSTDLRVAAFTAACRAVVMGEVRDGVQVCVRAVKRAFYITDLYVALGVVLLRAGQRSKAYAVFMRGARLDPRHSGLRAQLEAMGARRRPVIGFLRRSHPANRLLGTLRARLSTS